MSTATVSRVVAARFDSDAPDALGPNGPGWAAAQSVEVPLEPTPLAAQPSAYVQAAWADRNHGVTPSARVAAALAGGVLRLRVRWKAPDPRPAITDNNVYADGCAVMFPLDGKRAELQTMGDAARPIQAWHWRAGAPIPFVVTATGLGTTARQPAPHGVAVEAAWAGGEWTVVFSRAQAGAGVPLRGGTSTPLALAIWQGAAEERAGLASHTPGWLSLELPG